MAELSGDRGQGTGSGRAVARVSGLALALLLFVAAPAEAQRTTRKGAAKSCYFSPKGGAMDAIAKSIDGARKTVDIAMYSISTEGRIVKALKRAVKRKVKVRMLLHKALADNKENAKLFAQMGLKIYGVGPTMHHKFAIIDKTVLLSGSGNWSLYAEERFNEVYMVFRESPKLTSAFQREFDRLLAMARSINAKGVMSKKPEPKPFKKTKRNSSGAWFTKSTEKKSPVVADQIIKAMRKAEKSIDIMVAHFNSERITRALIKLHKQRKKTKDRSDDLTIRVLLDRAEFDDSKSRCRELEKAGITVRYKVYSLGFHFPRAQLMHHKTLIVDDELVVTGSYNWSDTAEHSNYENVVVLKKSKKGSEAAAMVKAFVAEFARLWKLNRKHLKALTAAITSRKGQKGYRSVIPIHFDRPYWDKPITMNRKELDPIMKIALASGLEGNEAESYLSKNVKKPLPYVRGKLIGSAPKKKKPAKPKGGKKSS